MSRFAWHERRGRGRRRHVEVPGTGRPLVRKRWEEAIASIQSEKECLLYKGLTIEPQEGLIPIGRDRESGLWEFAHPETGEVPERDQDGKLILTEETGLVFVLIPGGTFHMGAVRAALGVRFPEGEGELRIDEILEDTLARKLELQVGDVVVGVSGQEVGTVEDLENEFVREQLLADADELHHLGQRR